MTAEEKIIYLLIDVDGEAICAFTDRDKAYNEAKDSGCLVQHIRLINP